MLASWPGLLEAWLVLTSVKYHGNLYILIPLNQRLALTRLRATGPWLLPLRKYNVISDVRSSQRKNRIKNSTYLPTCPPIQSPTHPNPKEQCHVIGRWNMVVRVCVVLNRNIVYSDWHFENLCGSHFEIQTWLQFTITSISLASTNFYNVILNLTPQHLLSSWECNIWLEKDQH